MRFLFEDCVLDVSRRELSRGGATVLVEPKVFDLLVYLIENRERLVTKDDLIGHVWDGRIVSDSALASAINAVRKAVGDSGQNQRLIRTSARKGFRFVGEARREDQVVRSGVAISVLPVTRYASSGGVNIAYQMMGEGPVDLVLYPGVISHVEYLHELPGYTGALRQLASFARVITFDKRGQGLSDRVTDAATLEERIDDVRSVMDAVGSKRALIMGFSDGGAMSAVFAATYPERVSGLILHGSMLRGRNRDPLALERWIVDRTAQWGSGAFVKNVASAHSPIDAETAERFGRLERLSASPGSLRAILTFNNRIDVAPVLSHVRVPTLVLHRQGDAVCPVERGREAAALIPGARLIEYPGGDHAFWTGDTATRVADIRHFISGHRDDTPQLDRVLATVLSVGAVQAIGDAQVYRSLVERHRGALVTASADGLFATFDGPSRAVQCALELARTAQETGQPLRTGLHAGEIESQRVNARGGAFDAARSVMTRSRPGEVLVSRVVVDLVVGTGLRFDQRGAYELAGLPGRWELYAATP